MSKEMFKKVGALLLAFVMVFTFASCGGGEESSGTDSNDEVFELSLSTHGPAMAGTTAYMQKWIDEITEKTNGRVKVTIYPGGTLAGAADALDAVKTNACDIAWIFTGFYANQYPLTDVASLPLMGIESTTQATNALWDMYETNEDLQTELSNDFKTLMLYTNNPNYIGTKGKKVENIDDVKGLKLRGSAGVATEMITAWGGTPISMSPADMYQSIEKGVINGFVFEYSGIGDFNLVEVTDNYLEVPVTIGPFLLVMNKAKWESLPDDLKTIIDECSGRETSLGAAKVFEDDYVTVRQELLDKGANIIQPSEDVVNEFKVAADEYNSKWAENNKKDGFDAEKYLEDFKVAVEKYAQ